MKLRRMVIHLFDLIVAHTDARKRQRAERACDEAFERNGGPN